MSETFRDNPRGYFDRISGWYGEVWTIEEENRIVAREAVASGHILEIGCGNGRMLKNLPPHAIGLDFSFEMLRQCGKNRVVQGEACRLPFRRGTIETIFVINMIHNLPRPDEVIAEIRRAAPRRVVVDFRNLANPIVMIKSLRTLTIEYRSHFAFFWRRILSRAGLPIKRVMKVRRPLSDPREGFRFRHVVGAAVSWIIPVCYVGISEPQ